MLRLFVSCLPTILLTETPQHMIRLRRLSSSRLYLAPRATEYLAKVNSSTSTEEPTLRDVVRQLIAKTQLQSQHHEYVSSPSVLAKKQSDTGSMIPSLLDSNHVSVNIDQSIRNVHEVLNLFNTSSFVHHNNRGSKKDMYVHTADHHQVAVKSIEGTLRRCLSMHRESHDAIIPIQTLEELQDLLWRCFHLGINPSLTSLETMWSLQQEVYERQMEVHLISINNKELVRRHVGRSVRLLNNWVKLSQRNPSSVGYPPLEYVNCVFQTAKDEGMSMTSNMWSLYLHHHDRACIFYFSTILSILAASPLPWKEKQVVVLKHCMELALATNDGSFVPTIPELESALESASASGLSTDATWLYRELKERCKLVDEESGLDISLQQRYFALWIQAIFNDDDVEGSLLYLEDMLLRSDSDINQSLQSRHIYNSYLEKLAMSGIPDAGIRSEAFFLQWQHRSQYSLSASGKEWHPDERSVHAVALAYLQAKGSKDVMLSEAQRFLANQNFER
jgi:hypothetical protein